MTSTRASKTTLFGKLVPLGIPLAWLQLVAEKKRFAAALAGITFAVIMMLFQIGLKTALFDQVVAPHIQMKGDVVIVEHDFEYLGLSHVFTKRRLTAAYGLPEVSETAGLYIGNLPMKNPVTTANRDILVLAFDPTEQPFFTDQITRQQHKLRIPGTALFDTLSRKEFGPIEALYQKEGPVQTEVAGKRIEVDGLFQMGATFAADGNILMNVDDFMEIWPHAHPNLINVGLITLKPGESPSRAAERLRSILPNDVRVMTMAEFIQLEKDYWAERTPIGFVITASMLVAVVVGAVIVYQILYTDVTDHLPEYATLKSIGFTDGYFVNLILQESLILSVLGFIPGTIITAGLYYLTRELAYMPTYLTVFNVSIVFLLTVVMCGVAGLLATRKLRHANPADIF